MSIQRTAKLFIPLLATSALIAACGGSSSTSSSSSTSAAKPAAAQNGAEGGAAVKTASSSALGKTVLVDSSGMTLYALSGERGGKFICSTSECEAAWHPLTVASGSTPSGSVGSLGTVMRPSGAEQVTYKGMPLYTFARDQAPGEANGEGVKDVGTWSAVTPSSGEGAAKPAPSTGSSSSSSSGGGGGYGY